MGFFFLHNLWRHASKRSWLSKHGSGSKSECTITREWVREGRETWEGRAFVAPLPLIQFTWHTDTPAAALSCPSIDVIDWHFIAGAASGIGYVNPRTHPLIWAVSRRSPSSCRVTEWQPQGQRSHRHDTANGNYRKWIQNICFVSSCIFAPEIRQVPHLESTCCTQPLTTGDPLKD